MKIKEPNAAGQNMIQMIQYFLDHGFNVHKYNGRYGAQCLYALVLFQERSVIEVTKLLFHAGAEDISTEAKQTESGYSKSTFGMYNGNQENVTMIFHIKMIDTVVDQFGKDIWPTKIDDRHFKVTLPVAVSPQFFAWVFGLGGFATIVGPDNVVQQMKDMLEKVSKRYE